MTYRPVPPRVKIPELPKVSFPLLGKTEVEAPGKRPLVQGETTVGYLFRLPLIWPFFGGEGVYWPFTKWTEEVLPVPSGAPEMFHRMYASLMDLQQRGCLRRWDVMLYVDLLWDCWVECVEHRRKARKDPPGGVFGAYSYLGEPRDKNKLSEEAETALHNLIQGVDGGVPAAPEVGSGVNRMA
jgi:hypothetical protein